MQLYRFLTGPDDASFCHKVTEALNKGWELYGSPQLTYNQETKKTQCGQAVIKTVLGKTYSPDMKLGAE
ncbi:MAG: hypothetical protein DHS20C08_15770 [Rhodomicrobium sp.]|nr:MAG: hypothetical protein DHS20C08_15770 [Rhodomicrobium sp.]